MQTLTVIVTSFFHTFCFYILPVSRFTERRSCHRPQTSERAKAGRHNGHPRTDPQLPPGRPSHRAPDAHVLQVHDGVPYVVGLHHTSASDPRPDALPARRRPDLPVRHSRRHPSLDIADVGTLLGYHRLVSTSSSVDVRQRDEGNDRPGPGDDVIDVDEKTVFVLSRFDAQRRCLDRLRSTVGRCLESSLSVCSSTASTVAAKIIRPRLLDLEPTIQRVADIRVVHYVRDLRAVAASTVNVDGDSLTFSRVHRRNVVAESKLLCRRMLDDLRAKRRFNRIYPSAIITVRYEDFIADPTGTADRVFRHAGRPLPAEFDKWVESVMRALKNTSAYGIYRVNATLTAVGWRSRVT